MRRLLALPLLAIALSGCPSYDSYTPVVSQKGLIPPDQFARYGKEQAQAVAVAREFGFAYQGDTPADFGAQAAAGAAYARTMPDVVNVTVDSLGHRITLQFRSGWRTAVDPIADGRRGSETPRHFGGRARLVTDACLQVTVAASSREEADRLAGSAVEQRLAACGQVAGPIVSTYRWEGQVRHAEEWLCILKTTRARYSELETLLRAAHSYDNPEIIATAVLAGSADYLAWLRAETAPSTGGST